MHILAILSLYFVKFSSRVQMAREITLFWLSFSPIELGITFENKSPAEGANSSVSVKEYSVNYKTRKNGPPVTSRAEQNSDTH